MQLTYLPWVVEVPYLENVIMDSPNAFNHLMSGKDGAPSKIPQYSEVEIELLVCVLSDGITYS